MSLVDMIFVFLLGGWVLLACAIGQGRHLLSQLSKTKMSCGVFMPCMVMCRTRYFICQLKHDCSVSTLFQAIAIFFIIFYFFGQCCHPLFHMIFQILIGCCHGGICCKAYNPIWGFALSWLQLDFNLKKSEQSSQ